MRKKKIVLVYQGGIANVFKVKTFNLANEGRDARRLLQSDFRSCQMFAVGCGTMGAVIRTCHCNQAGDITYSKWDENLDNAPFDPPDIRMN